MNTIRSVGYGWGVLVLAGGSAYWLAKRSIAQDREARASIELERRHRQERMLQQERLLQLQNLPPSSSTPSIGAKFVSSSKNTSPSTRHSGDDAGDPSHEASQDPAPISHAPSTEGQRVKERSKYEASEPWRSKKGDRLG